MNLLQAQSFTKNYLLGTFEISSLKLNGFTVFGKDFSTKRGEVYTLVFNKKGLVKNATTGTIYNYEIIEGNLQIYQTMTYSNNYKIKQKQKYDLYTISEDFESCLKVKITTKKIPGFFQKNGYKFCKIESYPIPTYTTSKKDYDF